MKRTVVATVPVLALTGACLGLGAQPASADVLPLPLPTTLTDATGLLPTASPLPLPLPTASPLPLPLPTSSPLPLPTSSPLPLPLPGATTAPAPVSDLLPGSGTTLGTTVPRSGGTRVRSSGAGGTAVEQAAPWDAVDAFTGETPGLQLASASTPAWASALMGTTAFPTVAKDAARPAVLPAPLTVAPSAGSDQSPSGLPASLVAAAVLSLVVAGGAQVLARAGRL